MNPRTEIHGREFDWFAFDSSEAAAIFTTAGEGFVPDVALMSVRCFDEISSSIDSPNWGSDAVWDDYARIGLFVFDWRLPGGPYRCVRRPKVSLAPEIGGKLQGISAVPQFDGLFSQVDIIAEWSACSAT